MFIHKYNVLYADTQTLPNPLAATSEVVEPYVIRCITNIIIIRSPYMHRQILTF